MGRVEEYQDAPGLRFRQVGEMPGDRDRCRGVNDDIRVSQPGGKLVPVRLARMENVAGQGGDRLVQKLGKFSCESLRFRGAYGVIVANAVLGGLHHRYARI
jgi:hypothetical protein